MSETPIYRSWQRTCPACTSLQITRTLWRPFPAHWTHARHNKCRNCGYAWYEERGPRHGQAPFLQPLHTTPVMEEVI